MALVNLKSDLSWYGKNPGPYKPNANKKDTKFQGTDDIPFVSPTGYDDNGYATLFIDRFAGDSFAIDDMSYSDRGSASRKAQLGSGTKFPIGPEGQVHGFDKVRTGFSKSLKYDEVYGVKHKNSGLGNTYTADSPIDDMYNKFNLRDDATPNPGYAKQPFILRGIQREGSSDPQRWGLGGTIGGAISSTFGLPRGGILTAVERSAIDAARIGKFLISPKGIGFLARQFGYQLMNPNTENKLGLSLGLPATQLYNPLSSPIQAIGNFVGLHAPRHGIPFITGGPLGGGGEYGTTKAVQRLANLLLGPKVGKQIQLYKEITEGDAITGTIPFKGGTYVTLSGPKGPKSILGIGATFHNRSVDSSLDGQRGPSGALPSTVSALLDKINKKGKLRASYNTSFTENFFRWDNETQYAPSEQFLINGPVMFTPKDGVEERTLPKEFEGGGIASFKGNAPIKDYTRMAYGDIPDRKPSKKPALYDFRDKGVGKAWKDKKIELINDSVDESLIKFSIGGIKFKAYLGALNEAFAPGWDGQQDQGRADARYLYTSFERTITTDFYVPIYKESQRSVLWTKLQSLARKTYPIYKSSGFHGQTVNVTIGDMYKNKEMIITDLSYDWDNETPWEITAGNQAPFYTSVSISFTILGARPEHTSKVYSNI
tara:strand:- start:6381 stop:8348 length:1968 start_codon:yes stop_codon:yes gene_type:complete